MHIVSKFRDYYDSASAWGIDKECVFKRERVEIEIQKKEWWEDRDNPLNLITYGNKTYSDLIWERVVIGFCGELYPAVYVSFKRKGKTYESWHYSTNSYVQWLNKNGFTTEEIGIPYIEGARYVDRARDFFNKSDWSTLKHNFIKHKTPIFVVENVERNGKCIILNPILRDYNFVTQKDPASAFQEIHMFLSGVLGLPEKETIEIEDKYKTKTIDQHSFKNPPGHKRGRNRAKK